jgi:hypothetical protein
LSFRLAKEQMKAKNPHAVALGQEAARSHSREFYVNQGKKGGAPRRFPKCTAYKRGHRFNTTATKNTPEGTCWGCGFNRQQPSVVRATEKETKAVRVPVWLLQIAEKARKQTCATDFSDYVRGVILRHAKRLGLEPPQETHEDWPEWVKKQTGKIKYEIDAF